MHLDKMRAKTLAALCGFVLLAGAAVPEGAVAAAAVLSQADAESQMMARQWPYLQLNNQVNEIAASSSALAGTRMDLESKQLVVYWVGRAPAALLKLRDSARATGIRLVVQQASHSEQQLKAAAVALADAAGEQRATMSIELAGDGSGITVAVKDAADPSIAVADRQRIEAAAESVAAMTGIPVKLSNTPAPRTHVTTRNDDWVPFYGGAVINVTGGAPCTSGFSMYHPSNGTRYMLTAAHCLRYADGLNVANGVGSVMGQSDYVQELYVNGAHYDLATIRLTAGGNSGYIYTGFFATDSASVKGSAPSGILQNANYCISGAVGSVTPRCNLQTNSGAGFQVFECHEAGRCWWTIRYHNNNGQYVPCRGDSGGPIYYHAGNPSAITAAGIQSVGVFPVLAFVGDNPCYSGGGMSVVTTAVHLTGLQVVTS